MSAPEFEAGSDRLPDRARRAVAVIYAAALLLSVMDITIVNVALPSIGRQFGLEPGQVSAVSTAYLTAIAVVVTAAPWIAGRLGDKAALLAAIGVFTAGSALCAAAPGFVALVVARVLQGVGGGLLSPVGLSMLYRAYPPQRRAQVTATTGLVTGLAPLLGPALGGALIVLGSWRWVFLVNVPVGVAAVLFGLVVLRRQPGSRQERPFDVVALALAGVGLSGLLGGLTAGAGTGWSGAAVLATVGGGVLLLVFTRRSMRAGSAALVDLGLLRTRPFGPTVSVVVFANIGFFGALYVIAIFLQGQLRLSALQAGLVMLIEAVPLVVGTQLASRVLLPRWRARTLLQVGLVGVTVALVLMAVASSGGGAVWVLPLLALLGGSWSLVFLPANLTAFEVVPAQSMTDASTVIAAVRQASSAVGVAAAATVLAAASSGSGSTAWPAFATLAVLTIGAHVAVRSVRRGGGRRPGQV